MIRPIRALCHFYLAYLGRRRGRIGVVFDASERPRRTSYWIFLGAELSDVRSRWSGKGEGWIE